MVSKGGIGMKVKSFTVGLATGFTGAFRYLDEAVAQLNPTKIYRVTDMVVIDPMVASGAREGTLGTDTTIVRVVTYD